MNIINELSNLPNFGYVFVGDDGKEHIAVLGGHSCRKTEDYPFWWNIANINNKMQMLYFQPSLSDEDKVNLAKLMRKMYTVSESRKEGLFSLAEQETYLHERSSRELECIEKQITMHKDCRNYYRDYLR